MFIDNVRNGNSSLIPFEEIYNSTKAAIAAIESLKNNKLIKI
jgi:uncharacterized protein YegP (UPF0339 family)